MYEGEVTELTPEEAQNQTGGYGKVISHVIIGLKTVKGTKQLKLDPTIYDRCSADLFSGLPCCYPFVEEVSVLSPINVHSVPELWTT